MHRAPSDSWRSWLVTGTPAAPVDRRRVRGSHRGLKKILVEGMAAGGERPWKDFSGAMVRQAVNEAVNQLPGDHRQVVKLAYSGGLSNREIAEQLGFSVAGVQRRLRQAVARISEHVERGSVIGSRALYGLLTSLAARQIVQIAQRLPSLGTEHLAGAVAVAAVATTLAVQSPAVAHQPATAALRPAPATQHAGPPAKASGVATVTSAPPAVSVSIPTPPQPPTLPPPPPLPGLPKI